jgi:hypothetical protein
MLGLGGNVIALDRLSVSVLSMSVSMWLVDPMSTVARFIRAVGEACRDVLL